MWTGLFRLTSWIRQLELQRRTQLASLYMQLKLIDAKSGLLLHETRFVWELSLLLVIYTQLCCNVVGCWIAV